MSNPEIKETIINNLKKYFNMRLLDNHYIFELRFRCKIHIHDLNFNPINTLSLVINQLEYRCKKEVKDGQEYILEQERFLGDGTK